MSELLQFLISGITVGMVYALVALGFSIIYNASHVINFAQGEFVMIGGMATWALIDGGVPYPVAILLAILLTTLVGLALEKLAIEPARNASLVTLIIITIGASIFLRGLVQVVLDKDLHGLPPFTGDAPIHIGEAVLVPQNLWIVGGALAVMAFVYLFFNHTLTGKAILATSHNRLAARLMGINVAMVLLIAFGLSAAMGALGGILVTPISVTSYNVGVMLALKGFAAAILGGLGHGVGAVVGGVIIGIAEQMGAGYISSDYKDVIAFVIILAVLIFLPSGLFGKRGTERV